MLRPYKTTTSLSPRFAWVLDHAEYTIGCLPSQTRRRTRTMSSPDLQQQAQEIHDQLPESVDISLDDIEERLTTLVDDYYYSNR